MRCGAIHIDGSHTKLVGHVWFEAVDGCLAKPRPEDFLPVALSLRAASLEDIGRRCCELLDTLDGRIRTVRPTSTCIPLCQCVTNHPCCLARTHQASVGKTCGIAIDLGRRCQPFPNPAPVDDFAVARFEDIKKAQLCSHAVADAITKVRRRGSRGLGSPKKI
jgi:hypothetical protein